MFFYLGGVKITYRAEVPVRWDKIEEVSEGNIDRGREVEEEWEPGDEWEQYNRKPVHADRTTEDKEKPVYNKDPHGYSS